MHFSALTVLACALVAVTARPVDNTANGVAPAGWNNGAVANIVAPVTVNHALDSNNVAIANNILNGHKTRGAINVAAPVTLTDILNCNNVQVANDILNNLALLLKITVKEIGITVEDLLHHGNGQDVWSKINALKAAHGKRDVVDAKAPITLDNILNCNTVDIANNILNHLAVFLGITVKEIDITVEDLIHHGNGQDVWSKINALKAAHGKRGAVDVDAPITLQNILDCNTVEIANDILNHLAVFLGITVQAIDITVADLLHHGNGQGIWSKINTLKAAHGKRDAVAAYVPIKISDVLNCNTIEIANDLLNHIAVALKVTVAKLDVTAKQLVGVKGDKAQSVFTILQNAIAKILGEHKRDAVDAKAPVDVSNVANYNVVDILNNVGNGGKRDGSLLNVIAPVTLDNIANDNNVAILNNILNGHGGKRDGVANVKAPVDVSNVANYNVVDILNNVGNGGKRDGSLLNVIAPVTLDNIANDNNVAILNNLLNGGKRDGSLVNVVTGLTASNDLNDNVVHVANDILN